MDSINAIQPNFTAWREVMGAKGEGIAPTYVTSSSMDKKQLYSAIQRNINRWQWYLERFFGEPGDAEYKIFRDALKKAQEEKEKKKKAKCRRARRQIHDCTG